MTERNETIRSAVREQYAAAATSGAGCAPSCCAPGPEASKALGYSDEELAAVPEGANLGLGCGNPQAIAALKPGQTVLDLGSGAGFDCFLAARSVGPTGRVIGVDMTAEMVTKARENARRDGFEQVEFRLGEIEHLPVADDTVDVILSNCVINLSPEKDQVFREAFRVLRAGGRLAISDVVLTAPLPPAVANDVAALTGCVANAAPAADIERWLEEAGFEGIRVAVREESRAVVDTWLPGQSLGEYAASASIEARKPVASDCCAPACCE